VRHRLPVDDIHVFDSCSTDSTVAIAREAGAQVHQRAYDDLKTKELQRGGAQIASVKN